MLKYHLFSSATWALSARGAVWYEPVVPVSTLSGCSSTPNVCIRALRISARGALRCQCGYVVRRSDRASGVVLPGDGSYPGAAIRSTASRKLSMKGKVKRETIETRSPQAKKRKGEKKRFHLPRTIQIETRAQRSDLRGLHEPQGDSKA